jgi:hypothetical protein
MKRSGMSSPTSCALSPVTNITFETGYKMQLQTPPLYLAIVVRWPFCRPLIMKSRCRLINLYSRTIQCRL